MLYNGQNMLIGGIFSHIKQKGFGEKICSHNGDNFFKGVSIEDGYVCFTLNDKDATIIKLPFVSESELTIEVKEPGTLKSLLTDEDMRTVISLKLVGSLNDDDFATIRYWMFVVENVDLSETDISEVPKNAFKSMP